LLFLKASKYKACKASTLVPEYNKASAESAHKKQEKLRLRRGFTNHSQSESQPDELQTLFVLPAHPKTDPGQGLMRNF
jgi:hypothetical protein